MASSEPMAACVVYVTCGAQGEAETIAHHLVAEGLAACVNILPGVASVYRWQGAVTQETEWLLIIKTLETLLEPLERRVRALHSYTVPEFIALPLIHISDDYRQWLEASVATPGKSGL